MAGAGAGAGAGGMTGSEEGAADAVLLEPLTEETFLHNLHVRYKRDLIYTYVGNAVVCVNPCRELPLYSAELVRAYLTRAPYHLPPHVYAIAATAYRWVRDRNESQCIVITGESGSGKTEAARVCLQCAVLAGSGGGGGGGAGEASEGGAGGAGAALAAAGTLLEAFGNAATARNHNASRFGKLLDIEFDFKGEAIGGHITHYLLEKERARGAVCGERNFHVLYQLLAGADVTTLKRLKLQRSWEHYRLLRGEREPDSEDELPAGGGSPRRTPPPAAAAPAAAAAAAAADCQHFAFTKAAMCRLGMGTTAGGVLRILAFLLKLGNVEFEPQHNIDGSIGTRLHHQHELWEACALVGVDGGALLEALGVNCSDADSADAAMADDDTLDGDACERDDEELEGEGSSEWARAWRDRLVCAVYARLFTWLVRCVNEALRARSPGGGGGGARLSVLDAYGFESRARNAIDTLLVNYCAERVQATVCSAVLRREQETYRVEGLAWRPVPHRDHEHTAALLDVGPESVLSAIRSSRCTSSLLARLARRRDPRLLVIPPKHFQVCHFAGVVQYNARGMCADNRDLLPPRAAGVLRAAKEPLLGALFPPQGTAGPHDSPRRPATLVCRQRALVAALVRRMCALPPPRLVRCLRPAPALRPHRFTPPHVLHQLHSQGIVEMALLRRAGWCESQCARAFLARYRVLLAARPAAPRAPASPAGGDGAVRAARALVRTLPIPPAEFAFGRTKVFIRSPRTVWELEALRSERVVALVTLAQRAWRAHAQRRRRATLHRAATVIARAWRHWRRRRSERFRDAAAEHRASTSIARWWRNIARRRYLSSLAARLPPRYLSPLCAAWPPPAHPATTRRAHLLLHQLLHRHRCYVYRISFDQTARNRMREKVTASVLFKDRKASYPCSVGHPFVGDYVRLRASPAWRRAAPQADRYLVFADLVHKVSSSGGSRLSPVVAVVSTAALLLLEPRSLRIKRRVPAQLVSQLSLSPHRDTVLAVQLRPECAAGSASGSGSEVSQCSAQDGPAAGCLFTGGGDGGRGSKSARGDIVVQAVHALELATKLFLVVQNVTAPPHVHIHSQFEVNLGGEPVTVSFHAGAGAGPGLSGGDARLVRRGSRLDVLL